MLEWLIPVCLFWPVAALYLGGMSAEVEGGGGFRQILGLLASYVIFLILWRLLGRVLGGVGPTIGVLVLPTLVALLLMPLIVRVGYRVVGIPVRTRHATHA